MGGGGDGGGGCCDDEGGREAAVMTQEWVGSSPLLPKRSINQWARPLNGVMPCAAMDRVPSLSLWRWPIQASGSERAREREICKHNMDL